MIIKIPRQGPKGVPGRAEWGYGDGLFSFDSINDHLVTTIALAQGMAVPIEAYATGKLAGGAVCAFLVVRGFFVRNGAGAATLIDTVDNLGSKANGTAWTLTLSPVAGTVEVKVSSNVEVTWTVEVKLLPATKV